MTATIARLHAGDGYTYLTRQVATGDDQRGRGQQITDYYHASGAPPGRWHGRGSAALGVTGTVHEPQMKALFGEGLHPNADARIRAAIEGGADSAAAIRIAQLGRRFPRFDPSKEASWVSVLDQAEAQIRQDNGLMGGEKLDRDQRRDARQAAGLSLFMAAENRRPADEAELEKWTIRRSQPTPQPVAGFDITFTPVKSVSVLWGLADDDTRREIEAAHAAAVDRALDYIEREATFTRSGRAGIQQHEGAGIVATRFDHFDSRSGDPNLHTHVAIANRVQGPDGKWRTLDARILYAANVSFSECYNTALEDELQSRLHVAFAERDVQGKRPIREISGIDQQICDHFSQRRVAIEQAYRQLVREYRDEHGHEPDQSAQLDLAQQANLLTRSAKGPMESLADKRGRWRTEAAEAVGIHRVDGLLRTAQLSAREYRRHELVDGDGQFLGVAAASQRVLERVMKDRATWRKWHVRAETQRQLRGVPGLAVDERQALVDQVTDYAIDADSILLEAPDTEPIAPELTRANGEHMYRMHGSEVYTSRRILDAERSLVDAARRPALAPVRPGAVEAAITAAAKDGVQLDDGQLQLARAFAAADRQLVVGLGPAGTGKTRAMAVVVDAAHRDGARVIGLAPSAAAAQVFGAETGADRADTIAKILTDLNTTGPDSAGIDHGDLVVVDEAGMADTLGLARLVEYCEQQGATVRLLGDDQQLGAVGAGGALRLLAHETDAVRLTALHRFSDPDEAAATLQLRDGDQAALAFYADAGRIIAGSRDAHVADMLEGWRNDTQAGRTSLMLAGDNATVTELNDRARDLLAAQGAVRENGVQLHTGSIAGAGDIIVTRKNDRAMRVGSNGDFVKNGDLWRVLESRRDGGLIAQHITHGGKVTLPGTYVARRVELGYASTIHRSQGMTVDRARVLVDESMSREHLYVAMTRGRAANIAFTVTERPTEMNADHAYEETTGAAVLAAAIAREDESGRSAHETLRTSFTRSESLQRLVPEYEDALAIAHDTQIRDALAAALVGSGVTVEDMRDDPAYQTLARTLAAHIDDGIDITSTMRRVVHQRELDSAESVPKVLHYRLKHTIPIQADTSPINPSVSPALTHWLEDRKTRIQARKAHLIARAQQEPEAWQAGLPDPVVRRAVLYRDRWGITDTDRPLGYEPSRGTAQHQQWAAATKATKSTPEHPTPGWNDRLSSLLDRAQRRPEGVQVDPDDMQLPSPDHGPDLTVEPPHPDR